MLGNRPKTMLRVCFNSKSHLIIGIGYACAGHNNANVSPWYKSKSLLLDNEGNLGDTWLTGSRKFYKN
jgi:hypothetical protein